MRETRGKKECRSNSITYQQKQITYIVKCSLTLRVQLLFNDLKR
jgi:hypothetical protein